MVHFKRPTVKLARTIAYISLIVDLTQFYVHLTGTPYWIDFFFVEFVGM
jgi:hypothetical protein